MAALEELIEPECILPEQFFQAPSFSNISGEKRLILAVLEEGVQTYMRLFRLFATSGAASGEANLVFSEAEAWIFHEGADHIFSFDAICEHFNIEPGYLRSGILAWSKKVEAGAEPPIFKTRRSGGGRMRSSGNHKARRKKKAA